MWKCWLLNIMVLKCVETKKQNVISKHALQTLLYWRDIWFLHNYSFHKGAKNHSKELIFLFAGDRKL